MFAGSERQVLPDFPDLNVFTFWESQQVLLSQDSDFAMLMVLDRFLTERQ